MSARRSARSLLRRTAAFLAVLAIAGAFLPGAEASRSAPSVAVITNFPVRAAFNPNDPCFNGCLPFFGPQWGLNQIDAPSAWDVTLGTNSVIVAVVDTGAWWTHTDLEPNVWTDPLDGTHGYDFVDRDTNPMDIDPNGVYHGTGVSGVIGAVTDNRTQIAGLAQVRVMPVRALASNGQGSSFNVSEAIRWAANHGADVINLSLGTNDTFGGPTDIQLAINYAWSRGALIVAAAGNSGTGSLDYPARLTNVVSVAAIDMTGLRASFSNYGPGLDISAPGEQILTLAGNDNIHEMRGTSFAAPFVSATAALLLSVDVNLTNVELWNILNSTAVQPSGSGYNTNYGWGVVNAWNAINALSQPFISVNAYPGTVARSSSFGITWSILGPAGYSVTDTHILWGTVSGQLGNATTALSGQTRQSYTANGLSMPSGAGEMYFKVVATVNGLPYESREYAILVTNLPDFLIVLYQLLASNILYLALFILALAAVVAFLPQRRAARARRAVARPRTMYPPAYYVQAARPSQPASGPPPSPPSPQPASRMEPRGWSPPPPAQAPAPTPPPRAPTPTVAPAKKRCTNCGTNVNAENMFCFFCGHPFR